jgi:serine/threonine-protein kinase
MPGTVLGTATYLSPEQAQGNTVDHRTDIYSLGMVLYEALAGRAPFTGDSPVAVAYQAVSQTPPPPSTHNPDVPPRLDAIVMRAMSKDPGARQASAEELREELLDFDRATGDPDATVLAPAARPPLDETAIVAPAQSTSVLPPVAPEPGIERHVVHPTPPEVYQRRRAAVIAALALLAIGVIAALILLSGDDDRGTVAVPSVVGMSVADATRVLDDAGLQTQVTERESPIAAGQVADQDPDPGVIVSQGSTVTIFVPRAATTTTATTATTAPTTTRATPSTTATTTAPSTTQAPTTAAPTTVAPTTSIGVPTTSGGTTTTR